MTYLLLAHLLVATYSSYAIWKSEAFNSTEKVANVALFYLVPVVWSAIVLYFLYLEKKSQPSNPD